MEQPTILNELAIAIQKQRELEKQLQQLDIIKEYMSIRDFIEKKREEDRQRIENGELQSGSEKLEIGDDVFERIGRSPSTRCEIENIDEIPQEFRTDYKVEDAVLVGDRVFLECDKSEYYVDNGFAFKKDVNLDEIKTRVKLGEEIAGVKVKKTRASVTYKCNGNIL